MLIAGWDPRWVLEERDCGLRGDFVWGPATVGLLALGAPLLLGGGVVGGGAPLFTGAAVAYVKRGRHCVLGVVDGGGGGAAAAGGALGHAAGGPEEAASQENNGFVLEYY